MKQFVFDNSRNDEISGDKPRNIRQNCKNQIFSCKSIDKLLTRRYNSHIDSKGVDGQKTVGTLAVYLLDDRRDCYDKGSRIVRQHGV